MRHAGQHFDILICGTGFTGLTLATALSKTFEGALKIGLIGPTPDVHATVDNGRAFALSATASQMLQVLGVWARLEGHAQPVRKIEITDSPLEAGVRPVFLTFNNRLENGLEASFIVPAHALGQAVTDILNDSQNVAFLQGADCNEFSSNPTSVYANIGDQPLTARLLICADGRNSKLRKKAGIDTIGWSHNQVGIVTTVAHEKPHEGVAVQHFLPAGPFAILPLKGNRSSITWSENQENARHMLALSDADFLTEVDLRFGGRLGQLSLDGPRNGFTLKTQIARSYIGDRFALVGDAAHSVHPIAGQGLNLAFRDIAALCECLIEGARVGLDIGEPAALQKYQQWRRFDSMSAACTFSSLNLLFSQNLTLFRSAREAGLGLVDKISNLKANFVREAAGVTGDLPKLMTGVYP